jgi:hypothetical protein
MCHHCLLTHRAAPSKHESTSIFDRPIIDPRLWNCGVVPIVRFGYLSAQRGNDEFEDPFIAEDPGSNSDMRSTLIKKVMLTLGLLLGVTRCDEGSPRAYSRPLSQLSHLRTNDRKSVIDRQSLPWTSGHQREDRPPTMIKSNDEFDTGANS